MTKKITMKRHCEEIPLENKYSISEAIPAYTGIASALPRILFILEKLRNDAMYLSPLRGFGGQ